MSVLCIRGWQGSLFRTLARTRHLSARGDGGDQPCRVAVVGSGPAGFYTTQELLKCTDTEFQVDIFEKSAVPFGLVRYGVAPDHPEVKNCISTFERIASRPNVNFFGNVSIGTDLTLPELHSLYHVVVLAYGAGSDARLGIPGEDAEGCVPSSQFVGWFNGVPEHAHLDPDLSGETVVVVGHGNVALDCARVLVAPLSHLAPTDMSERALDLLRDRGVRRVRVFGRRGILQFQGTVKEVRELTKLEGVRLAVRGGDQVEAVREALPRVPRARKRLTELLLKHAVEEEPASSLQESEMEVSLEFGWSPERVEMTEGGAVSGVVLRRNSLSGDAMSPTVTPSDTTITVPCSTLITSIGYRVLQLPGVPFCEQSHRIPERNSRVLAEREGDPVPGLYTSGWARRGSDGVMATTITDSANTAHSILEDLPELMRSSRDRPITAAVRDLLEEKGVRYVTFEEWGEIDKIEKERGKERGKPREKMLCYQDILDKKKS